MFKLVLEKAEEPEIKLPTSVGSQRKQESSRKTSTSALLTMPKSLTVWITASWKILKEMGMPDHLTCLLRNLFAGQEQQLEPHMEQWTGSKLGREYVKAVYCHSSYLTPMQSVCVCVCMHAREHARAQSCQTLCDPTDCSLPDSSVNGKNTRVSCHFLLHLCRVRHAKCQAGWSTNRNQDCWEKYQ